MEQYRATMGKRDSWRTKAWRYLTELFTRGSHLQSIAVESSPQEKVLSLDLSPSPSKLSQGEAEMVGECCQDDWRTKAWRGLAKFFMLGSYPQDTAIEFLPQEKVLSLDPGPSSSKLSQSGAELVGDCGQDAWRSKVWRGLTEFFTQSSHLQAITINTRAIVIVANALKARGSRVQAIPPVTISMTSCSRCCPRPSASSQTPSGQSLARPTGWTWPCR